MRPTATRTREFRDYSAVWHWAFMAGRNSSLGDTNTTKTLYVSRDELLGLAPRYLRRVDTVLDIGCGIRPQKYITPKKHYCVDPHAQYLDHVQEHRDSEHSTEFVYI